ncbi:2OG-Fe dioxygenase family protein [Serpentinimonas barnesii]|uniref:2OG-Fe dioxygenase family protein n=1 Tax=Serpentinimonas barnesii TaxID=1458427 RepID=UPI0004985453|nr:2OG-Fe dioxygenase family protein [Serpentinimonas barnesii]
MTTHFPPPCVPLVHADATLARQGFALLDADSVQQWLDVPAHELAALQPSWDDLCSDGYLKDGGRYRKRRHSCFVVEGPLLRQVPHRVHWQPLEYNALHGGMQRWFEPISPAVVATRAWQRLLLQTAAAASALKGAQPWYVEAHQFRIDTTDGIGRPTPEGAHRDGMELVAVFLVQRHGIKGGESRVFEAHGPNGQRFTLSQPWSLLLLDDERVIHESTPIQPLEPGLLGWRDTLVLTCRSGGFQGD